MPCELPPPFDRGRAALVVAHPGHELRVHGWLELARPRVYVLTDGSGHGERGRLDSTRAVLERAAVVPGSLFGRLRDRDAYELILSRDLAAAEALVAELAVELAAGELDYVAGDAIEGFNPVHDLCRLLIDEAVARLARGGRRLGNYDFPLDAAPGDPAPAPEPGGLALELDDAALGRKLDAARAYPELAGEVESALARFGERAFRVERLRPVDTGMPLAARVPQPPAYENHGERRVAAGIYSRVLRFREHFLPLAEGLRRLALEPVAGALP